MAKFGRPTPEIEGLVVASGLSPLIACSLDTGNWGLMFAFVERWHKETSNLYLPVGEVTITLDDVALLLHLPTVGHSIASSYFMSKTLSICWWNYSRSALQRRELRRFCVMALTFNYRGL